MKKTNYSEIARLADCLKAAAVADENTIQNLYGVSKDEAVENIIKAINELSK